MTYEEATRNDRAKLIHEYVKGSSYWERGEFEVHTNMVWYLVLTIDRVRHAFNDYRYTLPNMGVESAMDELINSLYDLDDAGRKE